MFVYISVALRSAPSQTRPSFFDSPSRGSPVPMEENFYQERGLSRSIGGGVLWPRPIGSPAKYLAGMGPSADGRASLVPRANKDELLDPPDHYASGNLLFIYISSPTTYKNVPVICRQSTVNHFVFA